MAFLDSNAYIKLAPNCAGPSAGCWVPGPAGRGPGHAAMPRIAFHCEKTLTYLRRAYVSVYRYLLEVFL